MGRQLVRYLLNDEATSWVPVNGVAITHEHLCPSSTVHIYLVHMYPLLQGLLHDIQLGVLLEIDDRH